MILKLYAHDNESTALQRVVDILNAGGVVIYPTDSVYAIGCHALKANAIERICKIKGINPQKSHFSIICHSLSEVSRYAKFDDRTFKLLKRNLPGPFTFILESSSKLPKVFRNRRTVGIRIPDNPIISEIVKLLDAPIMTSSLPFISDDEPEYETNPELIHERFGNDADMIIDGGVGENITTTIVDCTDGNYNIVRQGKGILLF